MPTSILFESVMVFRDAARENASVFAGSVEVEDEAALVAWGAASLAKSMNATRAWHCANARWGRH